MLFMPIQDQLDCINSKGIILGKIRFDFKRGGHIFCAADASLTLTAAEEIEIAERLASLDLGKQAIPMQDDD